MTQANLFGDAGVECAERPARREAGVRALRSSQLSPKRFLAQPDMITRDLLAVLDDLGPVAATDDVEPTSYPGAPGLDQQTLSPPEAGEHGGALPDDICNRQSRFVHQPARPLRANVRSRQAGDLVVCTTPPLSFAEAVAAIAASGTVTDERLKSFRSDVRWIEQRRPRKPDGSLPDPLPCDPMLLRPILKQIVPKRFNISDKRWYNIRSELAAIQRKTGWLEPRSGPPIIKTAPWLNVLTLIAIEQRRAMFRRFIAFCEAEQLQPSDVRPLHLDAYRQQLEKTPRRQPGIVADTIRYVWNRLKREHQDFAGIAFPERRNPRQIRNDSDAIPASFFKDVEAYTEKLKKPKLFEPGFRRHVSEVTICKRRQMYLRSPSILIRHGWRTDDLTSMASTLTPAAVEVLLTDFHERNSKDGAWTLGAEALAQALKAAAHQWGNLCPDDLAEVDRICSCVLASHRGFSKTKRERLAQFDDPVVSRHFFGLPEKLWAKAQKLDRKGKKLRSAQTAKYALALAILIDKPLRASNLARLDLELDFARDAAGRITGIRIEGERTTKNAFVIEGQLSPETLMMLKGYLDHYRPRLGAPGSALFPGQKKKHAATSTVSKGVQTAILREIGATVNPHLVRSLIGTIILDEDPRAVLLAQRVLDHKRPETTLRYYAAQRGRAVNREYAELLQRHKRKLKKS